MRDYIMNILKEIVGQEYVSDSYPIRATYEHAQLPGGEIIKGKPDVVVMPRTPEQISKIMQLANKEDLIVVPRGNGSSQAGANIAKYGGILMDLARMEDILKIDEENMVITAEGGCSVYKMMRALTEHDMRFPFCPIFSCGPSLGASICTNATGDFMVKYGRLGDIIVGLEAVLPTGEIISLGTGAYTSGWGHYHRYTGIPDLIGLFVNSSGTIGIITKASVRAIAKPKAEGYLTYGWRRKDIDKLTRALIELQKYEIDDIHLYNEWTFFGPGAHFSYYGDKTLIPKDIHFVALTVVDALNEKELEIKLDFYKDICVKYGGVDIGEGITHYLYGPPHYEGFGLPGVSYQKAKVMGIMPMMSRSSAYYFYNPLPKFPEVYELWEGICKKYGYWNEKYIPAWLSWADRNCMNPYPMIVEIPINDEELKKYAKYWDEFASELARRGCPPYAFGHSIPRIAIEGLGDNTFQFLKKVKMAVDPKNILNRGVLF